MNSRIERQPMSSLSNALQANEKGASIPTEGVRQKTLSNYCTLLGFAMVALAAFFALSACSSASDKKLAPGRCYSNMDCGTGEACRDTFCEDIYYPEKNIKPY